MSYNSLKNRIQEQINLNWLLRQNINDNLTLQEIQDKIKQKTQNEPSLATIHHWRKDLEQPKKATTQSLKTQATKKNREQYNELIEFINQIDISKSVDFNAIRQEENNKEDLVLCLGDLHFGRETDTYNLEIAEERTKRLIKKLTNLIETYINEDVHGFENLYLLFLGDIIDGELVYEQQLHDIDEGTKEQLEISLESIAPLVKYGSENFDNVFNYCVLGNHGSNEKKTAETTNWDIIFYKLLELATTGYKDISEGLDNVYFDISNRRYKNFEIREHKFHIRHGYDLNSQLQTSSGESDASNWRDLHRYDIMCVGHYHFMAQHNYNSKFVMRNGALVTDDKLSERMGKRNEPRQWLFGVSDKRCPSFMYPVDLK